LDIAIESAKGLKYMHSEGIRHGDVKPDNILLNENLVPKISDFGLSKLLKGEKLANKVVGCEGYMDPVFKNTGLLTQKNDVYSFGVVLLELICRKQIVYGQSRNLIIEFRHIYEREKTGKSMFDEGIVTEEDILILEEIGKLAMKCLQDHQNSRPDMTKVTEELLRLRKNTVDAAACHNTEMSGFEVTSSSQISEISKLLPQFQKNRRINLVRSQSLLSWPKYM
jgi:serine/threonine protein kinase